jgi:hypothetical protein
MFARLHRRFGTAGLIVAIVALVAAIAGTAIAAGGLTKQQEKQVKKIAKKYAGKQGPEGKPGVDGKPGAAGLAGAKGDKGEKGDRGETGAQGVPGAAGETGFTDVLPPSKTEIGTWALGTITEGAKPSFPGFLRYPITFNIPLAAGLSGTGCGVNPPAATCQVHYLNEANEEVFENTTTEEFEEVTSSACHGSAAAPSADPGNLCVYTAVSESLLTMDQFIKDPGTNEVTGAAPGGAVLSFIILATGARGWGTWAVTAEEA